MTIEELLYLLFLLSFYSTVTLFLLFPDSFYYSKSSYSISCSCYSHFLSFATLPTVSTVHTISDTSRKSNTLTLVLSLFSFFRENFPAIYCSLLVSSILFLLVYHYSLGCTQAIIPMSTKSFQLSFWFLTMSHSSRPQY